MLPPPPAPVPSSRDPTCPVGTALAGVPPPPGVAGSFSMRTNASWFCDMSCRRAGLVCPICCRTAFNSCGFCWITCRICWNCGCERRNANGSSSEPPPDVGSVGSFSAPEPGGSSNNCAGMPVRRYSTARSGLLKLARKACSTCSLSYPISIIFCSILL